MNFRSELKSLNHNTILYGHHIGNNTMSDMLEDCLKQSFYKKHKIAEFDNKYDKYRSQVSSAYKITTKGNYICTDLENNQDYQQFLGETKYKSVINPDASVTVKDRTMTLSMRENTYSETMKRIVVVAKIIKVG